jgi:hypothetical protein
MIQIRRNYIGAAKKIIILSTVLFLCACGGGGGGGSDSGVSGVIGTSKGSVTPSGTSVSLSWTAPSTNSDGSPLSDLAGYKVYYGPSSDSYIQSVDVGATAGATISSLSVGSWCFAVTAYDTSGNESSHSNSVCI